jgi:hypothetical protein
MIGASLALAGAAITGPAYAQEQAPAAYIYATYYRCDVTTQERADEIVDQLDRPLWEAAVADGSAKAWGWMAHHTGGQWRRGEYFRADSIEALLAVQKKVGDQAEAKNKKLSTEFGKICNSHDDYIWRRVAGAGDQQARGGASFSVYHVCDMGREGQADELIKQVFAPMYNKMVADGQLKSWGWNEHIVGGQYRRLSTITAADMTALMKARASIVAALDKNPLSAILDDICGSHADYMWEIKAEKY